MIHTLLSVINSLRMMRSIEGYMSHLLSTGYSSNSEANASELQDYLEGMITSYNNTY